jgi:quinoprotein glucose dehydrogenase
MQRGLVLLVTAGVVILLGLGIIVAGAWLIDLGGSWYYAVTGVGFSLTSILLFLRRPAALFVYAAVVAGTLGWPLWEAGLSWWPLAARGDILFTGGVAFDYFVRTYNVSTARNSGRAAYLPAARQLQ